MNPMMMVQALQNPQIMQQMMTLMQMMNQEALKQQMQAQAQAQARGGGNQMDQQLMQAQMMAAMGMPNMQVPSPMMPTPTSEQQHSYSPSKVASQAPPQPTTKSMSPPPAPGDTPSKP